MVVKNRAAAAVWALLLGLGSFGAIAEAGPVITYDTRSLGPGVWHYDYLVSNLDSQNVFDGFTLYFDVASYSNLRTTSTPIGFDSLTVQPDTALSADGFVDLLHLAGTLSGPIPPIRLSLDLQFLAGGAPGSQRFEFYRTDPFQLVASGQTQPAAVNSVPEPGSMGLVVLALAGTWLARHGSRRSPTGEA